MACEVRPLTSAVTDRPGRKRPSTEASPSSTIRTGTRCTILVKFHRRVLGRQYAELRAGGRSHAQHPSRQSFAGKRVRRHPRFESGADVCQLAFLEIGVDPQTTLRHDGEKLGSRHRIGAEARATIADDPVDGRPHFPENKNGGHKLMNRLMSLVDIAASLIGEEGWARWRPGTSGRDCSSEDDNVECST